MDGQISSEKERFKQKLESAVLSLLTLSDFYNQKHNNSIPFFTCPPHQLFIVLGHAVLGGTPSHGNHQSFSFNIAVSETSVRFTVRATTTNQFSPFLRLSVPKHETGLVVPDRMVVRPRPTRHISDYIMQPCT